MANDAALVVPAAEAAAPAATQQDLQSYIARQTAGFYTFLSATVKAFNESGTLPDEIFSETGKLKAKGRGVAVKQKVPRAMTAFNFFMQQKVAELKEAGIEPGEDKTLFAKAVGQWRALGDSQRAEFTKTFKETHPQPTPAAAANGETPKAAAKTKPPAEKKEAAAEGGEGKLKEKKHKKKEKKMKGGEEKDSEAKRVRKAKVIDDLGHDENAKKHKKQKK